MYNYVLDNGGAAVESISVGLYLCFPSETAESVENVKTKCQKILPVH